MLLVDNNLSPKLTFHLQELFPGIAHVVDFGLEDDDDLAIWRYATEHNLHILTKDLDFTVLVNLRGFPPKVIRLNCGNVTTSQIVSLIKKEEIVIHEFLLSDQHGLLTLL